MNKSQRDAHIRLLESLPKRVHEWRPITREWGGGPTSKRTPEELEQLRAQLAARRADGLTQRELCIEFHCTNKTIGKLIRLGRGRRSRAV